MVRFLHLKKEAIFSAHGAPDFYHRHLPAFESHDSAPMGELRFPCNIIMVTLVAGNTHGFWWLVAGLWFQVIGCWWLVPSYLLRVASCGFRGEKRTNPKSKHSAFPIPNSYSSAAPGRGPAAAYSPASARHVRDPVDHRIYWLQ